MKKAKLKKQDTKDIKKNETGISIKYAITVVLVMLVVLVGFYFLTVKIVEKQNKEQEEQQEIIDVRELNDINYSDVENMVADSYYLLINKEDDENNDSYDLYINSLKYNNFGTEFYYIDLSKEENKELFDKDEQKLEKLDDLKVKDTTLIYVQDGKIKESYIGSESIISYLSSFFSVEETSNSNDDEEKSNDTEKSNKENSDKEENKDKE